MSAVESRTILVIGASGGLGSEITSLLQAAGARVMVANSKNFDLGNESSIASFCEALNGSDQPIDGVVLAAGLVAFGSVAETPADVAHKLMQVNYLGQASLVQKLVGKLIHSSESGNEPFVVSISGVIAENPMAGLSAYAASKTALHGYATAAARELRRLGIRWIDARPGHTETGLATRAIFGTAPSFGAGLQPRAVAQRIFDAIINDEKDLPSSSF